MEAPPLERKLVAILAADVAGYSRMMHQDEDATLATLTTHGTFGAPLPSAPLCSRHRVRPLALGF